MQLKNYDQILYDILKPLITDSFGNIVEEKSNLLYLNNIPEDLNSYPGDSVVYRTNISNTPATYGDGKVVRRNCACDITVTESGDGNLEDSGRISNQVEQILVDNNISYTKVFLGYNADINSVQIVFDFIL